MPLIIKIKTKESIWHTVKLRAQLLRCHIYQTHLKQSTIPTLALIRVPPTLQHGGAWQSGGAPIHTKYYN